MKSVVVGVVALMALVFAAFAVKPSQDQQAQPETEVKTEQVASEPEKSSIEEKFVYIQMKTNKGDIFIELNNELAPISTANFVRYAEEEYYNGTIFHRVIPNFMIQGGGFDQDMKKKETHEGIENEWKNGLSNKRGTLAMARLGGQANSGTSQFFINVADNGFLDTPRDGSGYAVFGKVAKGMDIVDAIRVVQTGQRGPYGDVPVEPVVIEKVTVLEQVKAEELGLVGSDG
jgi:cyclophilin family peptidyl-prolyl cis-trans isomerase